MAEVYNSTGEAKKIYDGIYGRLSDCEPIVAKDGTLIWYSSDGNALSFYKIDVSKLSEYAFNSPISLKECTVNMEETYTYTGSKINPDIELTYGDYVLKKNIDYTMTIKDNSKPGNATVTFVGKGAFGGELTKIFVIKPIDISGYRLVLEPSVREYDGSMHGSYDTKVSIFNGDTKITNSIGSIQFVSGKDAGQYPCTLTANNSYGYSGTLTAYLTITPKSLEDIEIILPFDTYTFDGTEQKPSVLVKDGDTYISESNYDVSYSNNINAGTATVTLTGKGNYQGQKQKNFTIKPKELKGKITISEGPYIFTGSAISPAVEMKENEVKIPPENYTVGYSNNITHLPWNSPYKRKGLQSNHGGREW